MRIFWELEPGENTDSSIIEQHARVRANLAEVRSIVAFGSARGGVGKSALLVNVAGALALAGRKVGIVDADLNSPSVTAMLGLKPGRRLLVGEQIEPGAGPLGLRVVASDFLPQGEQPPISFVDLNEPALPHNGTRPNELGYLATLRELLGRTRFGPLDLVLVDLAPGLEQIYRLLRIVPRAKLVLASHSSDLSAKAIGSALGLVAQGVAVVIGAIENMAGFSCDGCHMVRPLMPYGTVGNLIREAGLPLLERLPFDPRLAETCDRGLLFVREYPETPLAKQIAALAHAIDRAAPAHHHQAEALPGS